MQLGPAETLNMLLVTRDICRRSGVCGCVAFVVEWRLCSVCGCVSFMGEQLVYRF